MSRYPAYGYGNIQNMGIEQHNEAEYPEYEYSNTKKRSCAADLIRETPAVNQRHCAWLDTAERLRRMTAEEYLIEKMRSDADGQEHTE